MIKGMTGFGTAMFSINGVKGVIEVKSLNNRYLDANYYMPNGYNSLENKMRGLVQKMVERGRITIAMRILERPCQKVTLNKGVVKEHLKHAKLLSREFKLSNDLTLSDLIRLPGVLDVQEMDVSPDKLWPAVEKALKRSITSVVAMRKREGRSLSTDVKEKLKQMTANTKKISVRSKVILGKKKKALSDEEFQSFQKSNDINEELSRLDHYIFEIKKLLKSTSSVGKRIDFIAQEMQRETNTIGSKLQDRIVSNAVISMKSKIEKIREQAQNIE